jgi:hypothetical protein
MRSAAVREKQSDGSQGSEVILENRLTGISYILLIAIGVAVAIGFFIGSGLVAPGVMLVGVAAFFAIIWLMSISVPKARAVILYVLVFVLLFHPTMRIVINNIPLYFVDFLLGLLFISVVFSRENFSNHTIYARRLFWLVIIFWIPSSIFSFFYEVSLTNNWLETFYMLIRTLLSVSICFLIPAIIQNKRNLYMLLLILPIAMTLTTILSMLNSFLPSNHPFLTFLDSQTPADLQYFQTYYLNKIGVVRARALIGGPNHLGALLIICWSIVFSMYVSGQFKRQRLFLGITLLISSLGIVITYARSVYLGFALIVLWFFLKSSGQRGRILFSGAIALVIGLSVIMSTEVFDFDFVVARFASISEAPTTDYGNNARVSAYTEMPQFLVDNPQWLLVGRGFATYDLWLRGLLTNQFINSKIIQTQNHSLIVMTFYQRGLISAVVLIGIWFTAYTLTGKYSQKRADDGYHWLAIGLQASLLGMLPAWLFDHFFASTIHMQTIMFMVFGLTITMTWLANRPES